MANEAEELLNYAREELKELQEQGCDTWELERQAAQIESSDEPNKLSKAQSLCEALAGLRPAPSFPYEEPSELEPIRSLRPEGPRHIAVPLSDAQLDDKTLGAWAGRIAGCMLGKPVEGWDYNRILDLLDACGLEGLDDYVPECPGMKLPDWAGPCLRGNITRALRDDDVDYTIIGLRILEEHGRSFQPEQVAQFWLSHLPYHQTYTAERVAYRNFINGFHPPESAAHRNPYREWIGAQIRADAFGYACPGRLEEAAGLAFKDASISHVKNGIYGEMWVAAMLAAAFVAPDADRALALSLTEIPSNCRLAEAINAVRSWREEDIPAREAIGRIIDQFGHYHGVHTINNAAIVAMALLWGGGDFTRTIGLAVEAGWDTDCNGATAGSVMGALVGADALPGHWVEPLGDRVETAVFGESALTISGLAERTRRIQKAE
ncbi:MAG: ADP-ribosylglycohydrolase family protein [Planctomycetes bacterium]|nr:ADP-ribosylglycohydrolase family protein [Planctomycetota bacterium]